MPEVAVVARADRPANLIWKKRTLDILEITDHWIEQGRWWEGEAPGEFFLTDTTVGQFLLCRNSHTGKWYAKTIH
jgi:hypothetical protein